MRTWNRSTTCPFCGEVMDAVSAMRKHVKQREPRQNDISFCFKCGEWAIFDLRLKGGLRKPVHEEYLLILADWKMTVMRQFWLEQEKEWEKHRVKSS